MDELALETSLVNVQKRHVDLPLRL
jgi:hypothetical protein